jgi:hypothetical protein
MSIEKIFDLAEELNLVNKTFTTADGREGETGIDGWLYLPETTVFREGNKVARVFVSNFFGNLIEFTDGTSLDVSEENSFDKAVSKIKATAGNIPDNSPLTFKEKHPEEMFDVDGLPVDDAMISIINMVGDNFEVFFDVPDCVDGWAIVEIKDDNNIVPVEVDDTSIKLDDEEITAVELVHHLSKIFKER